MPDPCTSAQQHCSSVPAAVEQWLSVLQRKRAGLQAPQARAQAGSSAARREHAQASHERTLRRLCTLCEPASAADDVPRRLHERASSFRPLHPGECASVPLRAAEHLVTVQERPAHEREHERETEHEHEYGGHSGRPRRTRDLPTDRCTSCAAAVSDSVESVYSSSPCVGRGCSLSPTHPSIHTSSETPHPVWRRRWADTPAAHEAAGRT